ncbi:MAG: hypothetical protein ACI4BD_06485 [Paludibacteraceae bacterium]
MIHLTAKWMLACTLLLATVGASAQNQTTDTTAFQYQVGDTIIIKKECTHYLTGERMSTWVYYVSHPVMQVGTKQWPDGILLGGILSWVSPSGLVLQTAAERTDSVARQQAEQQQKEAMQQVVERVQEAEDLNELQKALVEQQAEAFGATVIKADSAIALPEDSISQELSQTDKPLVEEPAQTLTDPAFFITEQPKELNYHRFSIGIRGGAASLMHKTETGKWNCGFNALLDLQYAYYWTEFGRGYDFGILTGLSVGYTQSSMQLGINEQFTVTTDDGDIDYTLSADRITENDGQIQLEIPIMFSLTMDNGFFFNVGPKFLLPVYTPYRQSITNPNVDAYFQTEGVHVTNEVITGLVTKDQLYSKGTNANLFKVNITLTADLGYEWKLKNKDAFALGIYANYGLWNAFKNTAAGQSVISITPPSVNSVASVDILSATDTYASKLGYFDAGIKLTYHFNFPDTKSK